MLSCSDSNLTKTSVYDQNTTCLNQQTNLLFLIKKKPQVKNTQGM